LPGALGQAEDRPSQHHLDPFVIRVLGFQPEIRGKSYLAPGKLRQGVRPAG